MSGFDHWLDSIRAKPKRYRQRFALGISLCITGVIFFVWITTFHIKTDDASLASVATPLQAAGQTGGEAISVFAGKIDEAKSAWAKFTGSMSGAQNATTTAQNPQ